MLLQGQVGAPSASQAPGQQPILRQGALSDLTVSEFMGRYGEACYRRQQFSGATQAAVATTAAFATTYTGLVLTNPLNSPVNLHLNKVGLASIVAQTAALGVGIMVGQSTTAVTQTTAITPRSNFVGSAVGYGLVSSAATLPVAPTLQQMLGSIGTGATTVQQLQLTVLDLESVIILPPGTFAAIYTSAASAAASILASFAWQELPI